MLTDAEGRWTRLWIPNDVLTFIISSPGHAQVEKKIAPEKNITAKGADEARLKEEDDSNARELTLRASLLDGKAKLEAEFAVKVLAIRSRTNTTAEQDDEEIALEGLVTAKKINDAKEVLDKAARETAYEQLRRDNHGVAEEVKRSNEEVMTIAAAHGEAMLRSLQVEGQLDAEQRRINAELAAGTEARRQAIADAALEHAGNRPELKAPDLFAGSGDAIRLELEQYHSFYRQIDAWRQEGAISEATARQMKLKADANLLQSQLQGSRDFFATLATMQGSSIKELAIIGKAAAVTQATIDGILAVQKALASAPPPFNFVMAAAVGLATAANVARIMSMESGGYTGDLGRSQVAGIVHGQEFVVNAPATARNRATLEAMNAGATATAPPRSGGPGSVSVTIQNFGTSKSFETQQLSPSEIRVIARDEVQRGAPAAVAADMSQPNSRTSKALAQNTLTQRRR